MKNIIIIALTLSTVYVSMSEASQAFSFDNTAPQVVDTVEQKSKSAAAKFDVDAYKKVEKAFGELFDLCQCDDYGVVHLASPALFDHQLRIEKAIAELRAAVGPYIDEYISFSSNEVHAHFIICAYLIRRLQLHLYLKAPALFLGYYKEVTAEGSLYNVGLMDFLKQVLKKWPEDEACKMVQVSLRQFEQDIQKAHQKHKEAEIKLQHARGMPPFDLARYSLDDLSIYMIEKRGQLSKANPQTKKALLYELHCRFPSDSYNLRACIDAWDKKIPGWQKIWLVAFEYVFLTKYHLFDQKSNERKNGLKMMLQLLDFFNLQRETVSDTSLRDFFRKMYDKYRTEAFMSGWNDLLKDTTKFDPIWADQPWANLRTERRTGFQRFTI